MKTKKVVLAVSLLSMSFVASAALPTVTVPAGATDGDWLSMIQQYIKNGGLLVGLFLSVSGFLWLGWNALADLNQVRNGRKEWGEIGMGTVAGAAIFLWVSYLLMKAKDVI
jgi:integrating conjugative element membrane protein (TIGR03745 family)